MAEANYGLYFKQTKKMDGNWLINVKRQTPWVRIMVKCFGVKNENVNDNDKIVLYSIGKFDLK